jgi:hypothetical protein
LTKGETLTNDNGELALSTSWVGMRMGIDPVLVNAQRRAGELYAFRRPGSQEWLYPAWQFGPDWTPLPAVRRVLSAARAAGLDSGALHELLYRRVGVVGERRRLLDVLREGNDEPVLAAIKRARP